MLGDETIDSRVLILLGIAFGVIIASGLVLGIIGYMMEVTNTALLGTNCTISGNTLVGSCQELFSLSVYPFLALRTLFIWISYFAIFASVIGILVAGYSSGTSPVMMGLMVLIDSIMVYVSIYVSNMYRTLLENDIIRYAVADYSVYNRVMLYLPWFFFIVSIFAIMISIVNYQKVRVNGGGTSSLDY